MSRLELETAFVEAMYEHITADKKLTEETIWDYLWDTAEKMDEEVLRRAVEGGQP